VLRPPGQQRVEASTPASWWRAAGISPAALFREGALPDAIWEKVPPSRAQAQRAAAAVVARFSTAPLPAPRPAISPTALGDFCFCPHRYWLTRILRFDPALIGAPAQTSGWESETYAEVGEPQPRDFGSLLHQCLARLRFHQEEDLGQIPGFAASLPPEVSARAQQLLLAFVRSPLYQELSQAALRMPEVSFTLAFGHTLMEGRIDLLYCDREGHWGLIDYKTGEWQPRPAASLLQREGLAEDPRLRIPALAYALGAQQATAAPQVQVRYHFLGSGDTVPLSLPDPGETLAAALARLNEAEQGRGYDFNAGPNCLSCEFRDGRFCQGVRHTPYCTGPQ